MANGYTTHKYECEYFGLKPKKNLFTSFNLNVMYSECTMQPKFKQRHTCMRVMSTNILCINEIRCPILMGAKIFFDLQIRATTNDSCYE